MSLDHPGFATPVLDSQATFRAVLDAMARPGTVHTLAAPDSPPPPLGRATAATLLTLVDAETPLWLDPAATAARDWIAFHCGAPEAPLHTAAFALAVTPVALDALHAGTDDGPEDAATLILQVRSLGAGPAFRLHGPGLATPTTLHVDGLPTTFATDWAANRARFPRGIDLILCAGDRLAAFPRTLSVTEA